MVTLQTYVGGLGHLIKRQLTVAEKR